MSVLNLLGTTWDDLVPAASVSARAAASAMSQGANARVKIEAVQVSRHSVTVTRDTKALLGNQTSLGGPSGCLGLGMGQRLEVKHKS